MTPSHTTIRRKDRGIYDDAWIAAFLQRVPAISLSFSDGQQPFCKPTLFVYDAQRHAVYFHATQFGHTVDVLRSHPRVSLMAFEMGRLLPAERAFSFSLEYASVVAYGNIALVEDGDEANYGLQLLVEKYFPHLQPDADYKRAQPEEIKVTAVFRLDIETWMGKQKKVADDFPGAFTYPYTATHDAD